MSINQTGSSSLESALGAKVAVWVGAIALALGGVFLVKYSIDQGLLPNELRVAGGLLLGAALGAGAWRLRDRSNYVSQGLAAAAVIDLYACLWAAGDLYQLVPYQVALAGMVLTTVVAVAGALRLGPLVAIIGLLGAFLAPLLVGRNDPNTIGLFAYLLALQAGSQFVAQRRRWVWVSGISLGAGALWVIASMAGGVGGVQPGLFLLASTAVFTLPGLLKPSAGSGSTIAVWSAGAIGTLLLALNVGLSDFRPVVWFFFGVIAAGTGALGLWQRRYALMPWMSFAITLTLALVQLKSHAWLPADSLVLLLAFGGLFLGIGFLAIWREPAAHARGLIAAAPAAFLAIGMPFLYSEMLKSHGPDIWMYVSLTVAGVYSALAIPAVVLRRKLHDDSLSVLIVPAFVFLAVAWPFGLELRYCLLLWAAQLVGIMALNRYLHLEPLRFTALLLTMAINLTLLSPLVLLVTDDMGTTPLFHWVSAVYVAAIAANLIARRLQRTDPGVKFGFSVSAVLLTLGGAFINIHHAGNGGDFWTLEFSTLEISAHVITLLLMSLWLLQRAPHVSVNTDTEARGLRTTGLVIGLICLFGGSWMVGLVGNPWVRHEPVAGVILLNTILVGVGIPTLLMGTLSRLLGDRGFPEHRLCGWWITGGMIVLLTLLLIRQAFHGHQLWIGETTNAEHYAYSLAIALLALLALGLGVRHGSKQLRVVALAGILACSLKVFGHDMRNLEGIYRVLSFLGLGVSLMSIGYVYNRFVPKPEPKAPTFELELPPREEILTDSVPL